MRYAIITNPVSGGMTIDQKRSALAKAADILDAEIHGLDTTSADHFAQCARELTTQCDVLVVAGGDGTFSNIINAIDTAETVVGFLPLGTGNAMRHALKYRIDLIDIAIRIRDGEIREYDLINCDDKRRAFTSSVGIDGTVIQLWERYRAQGRSGFKTYFRALFNSYFKEFKKTTVKVTIDDATFEMSKLLTLMVVKQPYYGFGMKVVPRARFDDGKLHINCNNSGFFGLVLGGLAAFTVGNLVGQYRTGIQVRVKSRRPLLLQTDGDLAWEADSFSFTLLPKALKIKC
jgi:diacylglycerol kinase family enzyme